MSEWTTELIEKQMKAPALPDGGVEVVLESMILSLSKRLDSIEAQLRTFGKLGPREPVFGPTEPSIDELVTKAHELIKKLKAKDKENDDVADKITCPTCLGAKEVDVQSGYATQPCSTCKGKGVI